MIVDVQLPELQRSRGRGGPGRRDVRGASVRLGVISGLFFLIAGVAARAQNAAPYEPLHNSQFKVLRGMTIENYDGEKLGTLKDFVLDPHSGRAEFVIVKSSGIGPFAKQRVAPAIGLSLQSVKERTLSLDVTVVRWTKAPVFEKKNLKDFGSPGKQQEIAAFYHFSPSLVPTGRKGPQENPPNKKLTVASDVLGKEIMDESQRRLGKICDVLVDTTTGREAFILFSTKNAQGSRDSFAISLKSLLEMTKDHIIVHVRQKDLAAAPVFRWRQASDSIVYRYDAK